MRNGALGARKDVNLCKKAKVESRIGFLQGLERLLKQKKILWSGRGGCHTAADSGFAAVNIKLRLIAALQRAPATSLAAVRLTPVPSVLSERRLHPLRRCGLRRYLRCSASAGYREAQSSTA